MNLPRVIGLAGPARVGKDTAADFLMRMYPQYAVDSFAEPLKSMLMVGLQLTNDQLYGDSKDVIDRRYDRTPRFLMQTLGTEWGRQTVRNDLWLKVAEQRSNDVPTIFTDVRFEEKAAFVRQHGLLIHLTGRGGIGRDHASETGVAVQPVDTVIANDGSLEQLLDKLSIAMLDVEENVYS